MQLTIALPAAEAEGFSKHLKSNKISAQREKSLGLDGQQVVEFVMAYGPATVVSLQGLNEIIKLYFNVKKVRSVKIHVEPEE